ncbi:MAG TPA: DUF1080 domain-containing protein [Armatimonadota bacterium]|nr:DUF1080 domain-containing protein [Armatimonadota bacterium]
MARFKKLQTVGLGATALLSLSVLAPMCGAQETTQSTAPKGAVVLFSGKAEEIQKNWLRGGSTEPSAWKVQDGAAVAGGGNMVSREKFDNCQIHVEFRVPYKPEAKGQARGNSGVYIQGRYEIQVLDSFGIDVPGKGDCGAVYNQAAPLVNACKPPHEWETYDILFRAPRVDANGQVTEKARVTILLNGTVIQNNQEIQGPTGGAMDPDVTKPGPLLLQDHGNPVEYRNIWILPLPTEGSSKY